jgi:RNA polymerase sigma-70 factor, ECF subfamily
MAGLFQGLQKPIRDAWSSKVPPPRSYRAERSAPAEVTDASVPGAAQDQAIAAALLYDSTAAEVFSLVKTMVGDGGTAQDITADVYRDAWQAAIAIHPPAEGARSWLVAQAHQYAIDYLRAHRDTAVEEPATFVWAKTLPALEQLDDPSRDLLVLVYYRGYTCPDAAVLLGLPTDTAHSRLLAALRVLQLSSGNR